MAAFRPFYRSVLQSSSIGLQPEKEGPVCSIRELLSALPVHCQWCCCIGPPASTMLSLLHASMLHASPAEPGQRPARPQHGKPVAMSTYKPGEHIQAGRVYKRGAPTVDARTTGKARNTRGVR